MADVSIRDQMKNLVELQKLDAEFYQYKRDLKEKPEKIEALKVAFEGKKATCHALEEELKVKLLARKEREVDLQAKEADIVKANAQLSQLKTNKDYKAKLTEIENIKADKSLIEEKILILYDEADAINAKLQKEKDTLAGEEKNFLAEKSKIEKEVKELDEKAKALEARRKEKAKDINPRLLTQYERILKGKEGLAIVPVINNSCGGCYMNVPAQVVNEIKKHEELVSCEFCARILYTEEDL